MIVKVNEVTMKNQWFITGQAESAYARLICFPYAGGGAGVYQSWQKYLPEQLDLCRCLLPGREMRLSEAPISSLSELIAELEVHILPLLNKPTVFFGHSMGALIAFELCLALQKKGHALPNALVLSARRPPHLPNIRPNIHHLSDDDFLDAIQKLGGMPDEVIREKELLELVMPVIRADFCMLENYSYSEQSKVDCPIIAIGGIDDIYVPVNDLAKWRHHSRTGFSMQTFSGGHFYIKDQQDGVIGLLEKIFTEHVMQNDNGASQLS